MRLTKKQGTFLLKLARSTLEAELNEKEPKQPKNYDEILDEKRGVFVTLTKHGELRGCIGYPQPIKPVVEAVMDCAVSAAKKDPRFPEVKAAELKELRIEITVLTIPRLIEVKNSAQYRHNITIGKHGLIVEQGFYKGLLLPQVAPEWEWNEEEFLQHTCMKAGLPQDAWKTLNTKIYKFQGQIFKEKPIAGSTPK